MRVFTHLCNAGFTFAKSGGVGNPSAWSQLGKVKAMASRHGKRNGRSKRGRVTRRGAAGLSASAGAFLAFGMGPLANAPAAHADDFGVLDAIVNSLSAADPGLHAGLDGWLTGLEASLGAASSLDPSSGLDAAVGGASASATEPFAAFWQGLEQDWITSSYGTHVDTALNGWADHALPALASNPDACGLICNGADGTALEPN